MIVYYEEYRVKMAAHHHWSKIENTHDDWSSLFAL